MFPYHNPISTERIYQLWVKMISLVRKGSDRESFLAIVEFFFFPVALVQEAPEKLGMTEFGAIVFGSEKLATLFLRVLQGSLHICSTESYTTQVRLIPASPLHPRRQGSCCVDRLIVTSTVCAHNRHMSHMHYSHRITQE